MIYDVVIIGGGPAGMMAGGRAAELGAKVLLLEKNRQLGVKLLLTGQGRCNLTNNILPKEFIKIIGANGKFLYSTLHKFSSQDLMDFFEKRGLSLKTENNNRVFPESDQASDVLEVLLKYLKEGGVEIKYGSEVSKIINSGKKIIAVELKNNEIIKAKNFIIATGGLSYAGTGSAGSGYVFAKELGHRINDLKPGLTSIILKESFISELEGLSLKNVKISILAGEKKIAEKIGEAIFTASGLSGPVIHDLSKHASFDKNLFLHLDFLPDIDSVDLEKTLQKIFHQEGGRQLKNGLSILLPPKLIPTIIKLSEMGESRPMSGILRAEKERLIANMKNLRFAIKETAGWPKANITSGGVDLAEVDPKNMQSKIISNLFFAGEVLDLDGPTGGFNLQICWTTGYAAGSGAAEID